jgi:hypothetical protein
VQLRAFRHGRHGCACMRCCVSGRGVRGVIAAAGKCRWYIGGRAISQMLWEIARDRERCMGPRIETRATATCRRCTVRRKTKTKIASAAADVRWRSEAGRDVRSWMIHYGSR